MIKQFLLNTGYFVDNQYLDDYIDLIQKPFSLTNYTEDHHVLPVSYYKYKYNCKDRKEAKILADKDVNNLKIKLSFANHCKAHWLLYNCTNDKLKEDMAIAFLYMIDKKTNKTLLSTGISEQDYIELQAYKEKLVNTNSRYYSNVEKQFLIENANTMTLKSMAEKLGRSVESIHQQLRLLKIKRVKVKLNKIKKNSKPKEDHQIPGRIISVEISEELNKALTNRAKTCNITKSELIRQILKTKLNS